MALGLIWVSRECHPGHREDRSPYYHVRDVASLRSVAAGAACVLSSYSPSVDTAAAIAGGLARAARPPRDVERAAAPLVETVAPEAEDRSGRLTALVRTSRSAALLVTRRGYGLARVCRSCGSSAACASCGGPLVAEAGRLACRACGADARCGSCGSTSFGVERRGTERIAEWARRVAHAPVALADEDGEGGGAAPAATGITVGTAAAVKDVGPLRLDLVAILDPDRALARPGLHAGEQVLATWMEAAAWAGPRSKGGRVLLQTRHPGAPAAQALVRWDPLRFLEAESRRRTDAGFPPNHPVFRVEGPMGGELEADLRALDPVAMLVTTGAGREPAAGGLTICLVTVRPQALASFRTEVLRLAALGTVTRVEADPHL
jgi:primosomal protein N' (replication factor Y)